MEFHPDPTFWHFDDMRAAYDLGFKDGSQASEGAMDALRRTIKEKMNRSELQEQLIDNVIEGMDFKTMWQVLYDFMDQSYDKYTDEELITEVKEYYPELLEEN